MWYRPRLSPTRNIHRFCTAARRRVEDEGDWLYSSEWWGTDSISDAHTVFRSTSDKGNGVVSVLSYPSSKPSQVHWPETEKWLCKRYTEMNPGQERDARFKILGYQWRTLRFNEDTRQSTVKVMAAYKQSQPDSVFLMQQPHCLAVPYIKSMISAGFTTIASSNYDLVGAVCGRKTMRILCIGHGGGSLPLFLASKIRGAVVDIVEIDPLVISTSVQAMGFPAFSVMTSSNKRSLLKPSTIDEIMWRDIHERLHLYESDAEKFVVDTENTYDLVFIDAYDGDDIFPRKLWDADAPFLRSLDMRLHPEHGTVVVNLHADHEAFHPHSSISSFYEQLLPMNKHVHKVCQAYKDILVGNGTGFVFTVAVPWVCNKSMVVSRGLGMTDIKSSCDSIANAVVSKALEVENVMNLPFPCFEYIKRDFTLVD
ncbi:uncharacterized protein LOC126667975 [Mercurialis annua]|uniref:uncharacterized protein LOC126667975 n=1 Tax=Mercurialis annua TaxID=3986 RepID=UPI0021610006|nr:uncharacterized protein LOC126667975 [Mercurialis annua]